MRLRLIVFYALIKCVFNISSYHMLCEHLTRSIFFSFQLVSTCMSHVSFFFFFPCVTKVALYKISLGPFIIYHVRKSWARWYSSKGLKNCLNVIYLHLTNIIYRENKFSEDAKTALVRPLYNKNDRDKIQNYRPVASWMDSQKSMKHTC